MMKFNFNFFKLNKRKTVILSAMLVLLACLIAMSSVTFAKYVTTKAVPTQSATVAKWGFVVNMDAAGLFGTNYGGTPTNNIVGIKNDGVAVDSQSNGNVVAPGTTGFMTFSISGEAEVASRLNVSMTDVEEVYLSYDNDKTDSTAATMYMPMKWTLTQDKGEGAEVVSSLENTTLQAIANYLNALSQNLEPAEANATNYDFEGDYTLSWVWDFDTQGIVLNELTGNEADTYLGAYAHAPSNPENVLPKVTGNAQYAANTTVGFNFSITFEQIQEPAVQQPQP